MTLLSLAIYSDSVCGGILSGKRGSLELTDVFTAGSVEELFEKNERLKKNGISAASLSFSDHFVSYFFNSFKDAKEGDIDMILRYQVKDFIPFPAEEAVIGRIEIAKEPDGKIDTFSAVIEKKLVKRYEKLLYSKGLNNFTCTTSSFPFLNFTGTDTFALCTGFKDSSMLYFVSKGKLIYARKLKINIKGELEKTLDFYANKYKNDPVNTLFTVGNVDTDGIALPVKNILLTDSFKLAPGLKIGPDVSITILPAIGAALCV